MYALKKLSLSIVVAGLSLGALAAETPAQPAVKPEHRPAIMEGRQPGMAHDQFIQRLKIELSLSDTQVQAIEKIHAEARQKAAENFQNGPSDELKSVASLAPDSKEYEEAVKKAADVAADNARTRVANMAENRKKVYAVLDAEQKKKFLTLKMAPQQRPMGQMRQMRGKNSAEQ